MKKGKSNYSFIINAEPLMVHNTIQSFLAANGFAPKFQDGITYYEAYDLISGLRYFEYYINGNQVTILAYIGRFTKPLLLDNSFAGSVPKQAYKNLLETLFQALNSLNYSQGQSVNMAGQMPYGQPVNMTGQMPQGQAMNIAQQTNVFVDNANKQKETLTIIGFVISVIGLILSCFGVTYGLVILFLEITFAVNGLKTSKKGLAIATLVLAGVSFLILIFYVILMVMM